MTCTVLLRKWQLLTCFVLLTSTPSYVECSYSVRDDEGCQEMSCSDSSRSSTCAVNHSSRGGVSRRCSDLQLPRPSAWMLVALLSALAGATACWLANLLAPPPGHSRKPRTEGSSRSHRIPVNTPQRRIQRVRADTMVDHQHTS